MAADDEWVVRSVTAAGAEQAICRADLRAAAAAASEVPALAHAMEGGNGGACSLQRLCSWLFRPHLQDWCSDAAQQHTVRLAVNVELLSVTVGGALMRCCPRQLCPAHASSGLNSTALPARAQHSGAVSLRHPAPPELSNGLRTLRCTAMWCRKLMDRSRCRCSSTAAVNTPRPA